MHLGIHSTSNTHLIQSQVTNPVLLTAMQVPVVYSNLVDQPG